MVKQENYDRIRSNVWRANYMQNLKTYQSEAVRQYKDERAQQNIAEINQTLADKRA